MPGHSNKQRTIVTEVGWPPNPWRRDFITQRVKRLDFAALKKISRVMTDTGLVASRLRSLWSVVIRMAWHSAGTYRTGDGPRWRGQRPTALRPLNSWPDNVSLDKARRLLWPIKQKWSQDFVGRPDDPHRKCRARNDGFKTFGFGGGRRDVWERIRTSTGAARPPGSGATSATRMAQKAWPRTVACSFPTTMRMARS